VDQPVGVQPAGEPGLGDLGQVDLPLAVGVTAVPLQPVAGPQRTGRHEAPAGRPDQVVVGEVERVAGPGVQADDLPDPVRLGRDDLGDAGGVVDLGPDRVAFDQFADGDQACRGAYQGVVDQASADLLRGGGTDVEPDR